jgi:lipopolysaccharide export system permease protein
MIFGQLNRYFFVQYAKTMFWFILGVLVLIFLVDFSTNAGRMATETSSNLGLSAWLTVLRLPMILQQTIPFVTLFVGMTTLVSLNRKYELVVTRAAGISVWQFMAPFVFGAFLLGIADVVLVNPLSAWCTKQALVLQPDMLQAKNASIPWLRQISDGDNTIIGAKSVEANGTILNDAVIIHFGKDNRIESRQDARQAKLEHGYWLLNDVNVANRGQSPTFEREVQVKTNLQPEFIQESLLNIETIAFFEIPKKMDAARSFGMSTLGLETQFQYMLSMPFLLVAMTIIAATVSLKFSRFNQSQSLIIGGIVTGFVLYVVTMLVRAFGSSGVVPPFVATWVPIVVAMSIGAAILLHQEDG